MNMTGDSSNLESALNDVSDKTKSAAAELEPIVNEADAALEEEQGTFGKPSKTQPITPKTEEEAAKLNENQKAAYFQSRIAHASGMTSGRAEDLINQCEPDELEALKKVAAKSGGPAIRKIVARIQNRIMADESDHHPDGGSNAEGGNDQ